MQTLKLPTLKQPRVQMDLTETIKQPKGTNKSPWLLYALKEHSLKMNKPRERKVIRIAFLSNRVIKKWNKLSEGLVSSFPHCRSFWGHLVQSSPHCPSNNMSHRYIEVSEEERTWIVNGGLEFGVFTSSESTLLKLS